MEYSKNVLNKQQLEKFARVAIKTLFADMSYTTRKNPYIQYKHGIRQCLKRGGLTYVKICELEYSITGVAFDHSTILNSCVYANIEPDKRRIVERIYDNVLEVTTQKRHKANTIINDVLELPKRGYSRTQLIDHIIDKYL